MTVFKLENFQLCKNNKVGTRYISSELLIFFLVKDIYDNETESSFLDWNSADNHKEISNDILEMDSLRQDFDLKEFEFTFDDIGFKVFNGSGVWDYILSQDTVTEIRITLADPFLNTNNEIDYKYTGLFYGVVDKKNVSFESVVNFNDEYFGRYGVYSFNAYSFIKYLKEVPIMKLRDRLSFDFIENSKGTLFTNWQAALATASVPTQPGTTHTAYFKTYVSIAKIFLNIFKVILPTSDFNFKIHSNTDFTTRDNLKNWQLDYDSETEIDKEKNICIRFTNQEAVSKGAPHTVYLDYKNTLFDDDTTNTAYSFFKHENCLSLLKELLINFGLVWRTNFDILDNTYKYRINVILSMRFDGDIKNDILSMVDDKGLIKEQYSEIYKGIERSVKIKEHEGCSCTVVNYESTTNYTHTINEPLDIETQLKDYAVYTEKFKQLVTPFVSYEKSQTDDILYQCIFGVHENKLIPTDTYIVHYGDIANNLKEVYPRSRLKLPMLNIVGAPWYRGFFGEMVCNYYFGKYGIYTQMLKHVYEFEVDNINAELLDKIEINGGTYIIMSVEKDFIKMSSKIKCFEYRYYWIDLKGVKRHIETNQPLTAVLDPQI